MTDRHLYTPYGIWEGKKEEERRADEGKKMGRRKERNRPAWRPLRLLGLETLETFWIFVRFGILGVATCGQKSIVMAFGLGFTGWERAGNTLYRERFGWNMRWVLGRVAVCAL